MKSWVFALPVNREFWAWDATKKDYTPRVVTTEQARQLVAETLRALEFWRGLASPGSKPYTPPVLREHVREGRRFGSILDIKLSGLLERRGVWLFVDWLDATAADIKAYKSQYVSIGTVQSYRDGSGQVFGPIVDELSLTEHPRLRGIGAIQDTLNMRLSDAMEAEMTKEEIEALMAERITPLMDQITAQQATIDELKAALAEKEPEVELTDEEKKPEAEVEVELTDEEKPDEAMETRLADRITEQVTAKLVEQLGNMRLGGHPAAPAPAGKTPRTVEEKLKAARARGLSGQAAIDEALK